MKANEMMHGDLVMYGGHLCRFEISASSAYLLRLSDGYQYPPIVCNDAEPIPLTEEILRKNGFEFYNGGTNETTFYFYKAERSSYILKCFPKRFALHTELFGNTIYITYVHELQHALRLCGLMELADNLKI